MGAVSQRMDRRTHRLRGRKEDMQADKQRMVCQIPEEREQEDMLTYRLRLREGTETCSKENKTMAGNVDRQREWAGRKIRQSEG